MIRSSIHSFSKYHLPLAAVATTAGGQHTDAHALNPVAVTEDAQTWMSPARLPGDRCVVSVSRVG